MLRDNTYIATGDYVRQAELSDFYEILDDIGEGYASNESRTA